MAKRSTPRVRRRLNREQKKAGIRSALVDAAADLFAERGYWGVSLDEIAERAGLTKGAVYSNFESKEDLLLAVAASQIVSGDDSVLQDRSIPLPELLAEVGRQGAQLATSEAVLRLAPREMELATLSFTSNKVKDVLVGLGRMQRAGVAAFLEQRASEENYELPVPAEELGAIIVAVRIGMMQQRLIDPESIPEHYFGDALQLAIGARPRKPKTSKPSGQKRARTHRVRG